MSNLLKTSIALLLASCLSMSAVHAKQVKVTIGDGTSTSNRIPYGNYDKNSTTQTIYTQVELGSVAGPITGLAFDVASPSSHTTTSLKIYIGKSNTTTFASASDYRDLSGMTLVYDGAPTLGTSPGWEEIELQTPFQYDGKSNLIIVIGRQANSYSTGLNYTTTSSTNQCLHRGNDNNPEVGDPSNTSVSYSKLSIRPNIQLLIGEEELVTVGGIIYRIKEGEALVKGYTSSLPSSATIQSKVTSEGTTYNVTAIANGGFAGCTTLKSITIPSSITSIGDEIFKGCTALTDVSLPTSITEISRNAFANCTSLQSITIPSSVTTIWDGAFSGCNTLSSLTFPASVNAIKDDAFKGCSALKTLTFNDGETPIELGATSDEGKSNYQYPGIFNDCPIETVYLGRDQSYYNGEYRAPFLSKKTLTQIIIGPKVTTLSESLLESCSGLTSLTIPANVVKLELSALYGLFGLEELIIDDSDQPLDLTQPSNYYGMLRSSHAERLYLGRNLIYCTDNDYNAAFYNCTYLKEVTIGKKVKRIEDYMFYECYNLKTIYNHSPHLTVTVGDEGNGYVAYYADLAMNGDTFAQTGDFLYYEKNGTKTIYKYVGTKTDVVVPAGYLLESSLFIGREDLTSITFSQGLKRIPRACMERCTSLTSVTIPNSVEEIDDYALFGCSSLTSVVLPSGLKRLGANSLQMCSTLTSVNIPSGITTLEDFCLSRTALTSVTVPANVKRIGAGVFQWCLSLTEITLPDQLEYIGPFSFKMCSALQQIEIPAKVDSIAMHSFYGCFALQTVKLHEGLKSIGDFAFYAASVIDINLPNTLQRIGLYGLARNNFEKLILPESLTQLQTGALYGNYNLEAITIPSGITELSDHVLDWCSRLNDITLPETLTKVGAFALNSVPMKHIKWPSSIRSIGTQALGGSYTYGAHIIPASVTDVDCMLFYEVEDGNDYYCYSPKMLPENAFDGQVLLRSNLYVLPELVAQYSASSLGQRFKAILPLGDTNGDGEISIADVAEQVFFMRTNKKSNLENMTFGNHDANGDGLLDNNDITTIHNFILNPNTADEVSELNSIANVSPFDIATEPSDNCHLFPTAGFFETEGPESIDLINQMRWETCLEGVWKSSSDFEHYSMADYTPYVWSTDLERIARVRAIESYYTYYHERLNYGSCFSVKSNGVSSNSECLSFGGGYMGQLINYYGEKDYWMRRDYSEETGHYTSMIGSGLKYLGLAAFGSIGSMQATWNDKAGQENDFLPPTGYQTFYIDVRNDYLDHYEWIGVYNGSRVKENFTMEDDEYIALKYSPVIFFDNEKGRHLGYYMTEPNMTYTSSNPEVAYFDVDNNCVRGVNAGVATITATYGDITSQVTVTVTCHHNMVEGEVDENLKIKEVCSKCGYEEEYSVPDSFRVWFKNGYYYWSTPASEYYVGSTITVSIDYYNGSTKYQKVILECDRPDLLEVPYHSETSNEWKVLGAGDVTVTARLKYNPSDYSTYKLHLVEPEQ